MAAVLGIVIEQGAIKNVDQRMIDFFPQKAAISRDPRASEITLRHLLTMTDGIAASGNMLELFLSDESRCRPLERAPGSAFTYNIISPDIASMVVTGATGRMASDLAGELLFGPLGITEAVWPESYIRHTWGIAQKKGYTRAWWGLALTTRDMAKIGHLYLNEGRWDGKQVLPVEWVKESTKAQVATGLSSGYWCGYGFHWRCCTFGPYEGFYSYGYTGQSICVVPELRLVTVVTSTDPKVRRLNVRFTDESFLKYLEFAEKYLIGAVRKRDARCVPSGDICCCEQRKSALIQHGGKL